MGRERGSQIPIWLCHSIPKRQFPVSRKTTSVDGLTNVPYPIHDPSIVTRTQYTRNIGAYTVPKPPMSPIRYQRQKGEPTNRIHIRRIRQQDRPVLRREILQIQIRSLPPKIHHQIQHHTTGTTRAPHLIPLREQPRVQKPNIRLLVPRSEHDQVRFYHLQSQFTTSA